MIIGITGTLGAGKGTVVEYLVAERGCTHYSVRAFLTEEIERRGLPVNRDVMTEVANEFRASHGSDYIARELLSRAREHDGNSVIESIRSIGEAELLKAQGALLWAVDADVQIRYERITKRLSETDAISFEKFVADEKRELANDDPTKQNIAEVVRMADVVFRNDGTLEELHEQITRALQNA